MARQTTLAPGEFYHIYNRGVDKRIIYTNNSDYKRFQNLLYIANNIKPIHLQKLSGRGRTSTTATFDAYDIEREEILVDILSYCLMPNHFHILVKEKSDGGISKFMQKLSTGYTMYFNKRHDRTGALFQGKFKATHANTDPYLKYLSSYIHLNPIKLIQSDWKDRGIEDIDKAQDKLNNYQYSSYLDYENIQRPENKILNQGAGPVYFSTLKNLETEMQDWLTLTKKE